MKASLSTLHHQSQDWLRELEFYKEELTVLSNRLNEIGSANTNKEVLAQVEHYLNRFVILRERLDTLRHDVNLRNDEVNELIKSKSTHIYEKFVETNTMLHERVAELARSIAEERFAFNNFLAKYF